MAFGKLKMVVVAAVFALLSTAIFSAGTAAAITCPRPAAGSVVAQPVNLYSDAGVLNVTLDYVTSLDSDNRTLFCFVTPEGVESPTLHVKPGDTLKITLTNKLPSLPAGAPREALSLASNVCGSRTMDATSVNLHFHGTNTSPVCHADGVIDTLIDSGQTFVYYVTFPRDEPPGLYWYHPHVHGLSDAAVQGGASGAIVIDGIENEQPAVAGLPARILVIRDQIVHGFEAPNAHATPVYAGVPSWDLTLNYVPIAYPSLAPAMIESPPGRREFWRVLNASADTILNLQLNYDGVPQTLEVVALDGVCIGSRDGTRRGKTMNMTHILLPPAGRAEFIITSPTSDATRATLETQKIQTGPAGDNDTARILAVLRKDAAAADPLPLIPAVSASPGPLRFEGLDRSEVTARRKLYFSEAPLTSLPEGPTNFYITVDGAKPVLFSPTNPPAIVTTEGAVEDWTIENRTQEVHEFHIHQIHFMMRAQNGVPLPQEQRQFRDTVQVPFWQGSGPYPSITVRMDFRGRIAGDFVYHCHILDHEDNGMMATIRVLPTPR